MLNRLITIVAALVVTFAATLCHANFAIFQANGSVPAAAPVLTSRSLVGSSPAVLNAQLTWQGASASVASNQALNSCNITAGDPNGNFTSTASGSACVLTISANGVTNLNGTSGSVSQTLTVTGTNGNGTSAGVSVSVTVWADGSTGAPSCTPPQSSLLSGYAARAPWPVAGVDYCVGIPSSVTLSDPAPSGTLAATLTADGCSLSGATISCSGSNCNNKTIQGWDFSLHGNGLSIGTCSGLTIQNNNFLLASSINAIFEVTGTTNLTIQNNVIDANGFSNSTQGVIEGNSPSMVVQYNIIRNGAAEDLRLGSNTTSGFTNTIQFNIIQNAGVNATNTGLHGDWTQIIATPTTAAGATFQFNTMIQNDASPPTQSQGISYNGNPGGTFTNVTMLNNTVIATNTGTQGTTIDTFFNYDVSRINTNAIVSNNYVDRSGIGALGTLKPTNWIGPAPGSGGFSASTTCSGNYDMVAGTPITGTFNSYDGVSVTCN